METTEILPVERRTYIGGSDIGAILGWNKHRTPLDVYNDKLGLTPAFAGNQHTERGKALEAVAAEWYTKETSNVVRRQRRRLVHRRYGFLGGHIDYKVALLSGIIEIKCPSLGSYSKIKRMGLDESYIAQAQWYMGLGGYDWCDWVIFCADQWEGITFRVVADRPLFEQMEERAVAFWRDHVMPQVPPPAAEADAARIEIARAEGTMTVVERADPEYLEAVSQLQEAKRLKVESEALEAAARERWMELTHGLPAIYVAPGSRITLATTKGRTSFDQKALASVRPVDRIAVAANIRGLLVNGLAMTDEEIVAANLRSVLDGCDLDLSAFTATGKPGTQLRTTFYGSDL